MKPLFECACANCAAACQRRPGWFAPGEAEDLAESMGISFAELFATRLAIDAVGTYEHGELLILMPAIVGVPAGRKLPPEQFGTCTFFDNGLCQIHEGKPFECAVATHWGGPNPALTAAEWLSHQDQLRVLAK